MKGSNRNPPLLTWDFNPLILTSHCPRGIHCQLKGRLMGKRHPVNQKEPLPNLNPGQRFNRLRMGI